MTDKNNNKPEQFLVKGTREEMAVFFETILKEEESSEILQKCVDDDIEKPLEYYLGEEKMALLVITQLDQMGEPFDSPMTQAWLRILSRIAYKIVSIQKKQDAVSKKIETKDSKE
ncbi:MAG: hypothetical protein KAI72_05665 [Candidatus Pacebacteria bacterium]|nr:hypothetical protein [Candidatus Paceibacterota bacterium]